MKAKSNILAAAPPMPRKVCWWSNTMRSISTHETASSFALKKLRIFYQLNRSYISQAQQIPLNNKLLYKGSIFANIILFIFAVAPPVGSVDWNLYNGVRGTGYLVQSSPRGGCGLKFVAPAGRGKRAVVAPPAGSSNKISLFPVVEILSAHNNNGSKHHCLLPLLIVTANTFLTMCMVRTCALWWSRGELNSLFEQIMWFYCALLPAFPYFFRTFSYRLVSTRDRFWRVKSTGKSTWGEEEKCTKLMFSIMERHRGVRLHWREQCLS